MKKYKYELHASRKNEDLIVDRYEQFYDDAGNLVAESKPHTLCAHPGIVDPDWPWDIRTVVNARHVPEVVAKYQAEQEYNNINTELEAEDTTTTRQRRENAKAARDAARKAYDDFVKKEL